MLTDLEWVAADGVVFPIALFHNLRDYLQAGKHGNIRLDVKGGKIISWAFTETGRIDKGSDAQVD